MKLTVRTVLGKYRLLHDSRARKRVKERKITTCQHTTKSVVNTDFPAFSLQKPYTPFSVCSPIIFTIKQQRNY